MKYRISYLYVLILLFSCLNEHQSTIVDSINIPLDSITSSQTDYVLLEQTHNRFFIKSPINNSFEVYDWSNKEKIASIYTPRHLIQGGKNQSLTYVNRDTILLLQRDNGNVFYANEYGHLYDKLDAGLKALPHFSTTTNPPIYYRGRLFVSVLPNISSKEYDFINNSYAIEYIFDIRTKSFDQVTLVLPKQTNLFETGLRHNIATRSFANGKLNYVWGGSSDVLQFDLDNHQQTMFRKSGDSLKLTRYQGEYLSHKDQQSYYFEHEVYDHISYDAYRKVYYIYLLDADASILHKFQRGFTIFKSNEKFELVSKKHFQKDLYVFDNELITKDGLYLSTNNPFSQTNNENMMTYVRINLE